MAAPAPRFFATPAAFRAWLAKHHATERELFVGLWKVGTGKAALTWSLAVDEALCFGWIDGLTRGIDEARYCIRFTPRRPRSNWSAVNRRKVEALLAAGRMTPAGLAAWEARPDGEHAGYSFEVEGSDRLPAAMERRLKANRAAWAWFSARPPGERRATVHWVTSAKQEATRARRLEVLIETAARGVHVPPFELMDRRKAKALRPRSPSTSTARSPRPARPRRPGATKGP